MRVLRIFSNVVWLATCGAAFSACGDGSTFSIAPESLRFANVSAAYVPELPGIRLSWLPLVHRDIEAFEIDRAGPFEPSDPVSTDTVQLEFAETVTPGATIYDDINTDFGKIYFYRLRIKFLAKAKVTATVESPVIKVNANVGDPLPPPAGHAPDMCVAVTEAAFVDGTILQKTALDPGTSPTARLTSRLFQTRASEFHWRVYSRNTPFIDAASEARGTPVGVNSSQTLSVSPLCNDLSFEFWKASGGQTFAEKLTPLDYALTAEFRLYGLGSDKGDLVPPFYRIVFPNLQAESFLALENITPDPIEAIVLETGIHYFQANLRYRLANAPGHVLSARLVAVGKNGAEELLDIRTYDIATTAATEQYAAAITIPENTQAVRLIGRIGTGTLSSVHVQDEIVYGVVP